MSAFQKAKKSQAKLRLAFDGPAGSGKTYSSLLLAKALGGKTALIDSEHGSASKYADLVEFDTVNLDDHSPMTYVKYIEMAAKEGYENIIIDSLSHAWMGKNGALEMVDREKDRFGGGWKKVTPLQNRLVDAILSSPCHVISTMRTKLEYAKVEENGKTVIKKMGMAPIQRDGVDYEMDVVIDLTTDGNVNVSKTRCSALKHKLFTHEDVEKMGEILKGWLSDGEKVDLTRKMEETIGFEPVNPAVHEVMEAIRHAPNKDALMAVYNDSVVPAGLQKFDDIMSLLKTRKAELS